MAALADGVPQALAQVGLAGQFKIITADPESTDLQEIAAGTAFAPIAAVDVATVWRCAGILARASVGETIAADLLQPDGWHKIITKDNVDSADGVKPESPDFRATFTAAWKA